MAEAVLQVLAHIGFFPDEIPRENQQVHKVEFPCAPLLLAVALDQIPHLDSQSGREIGARRILKQFQRVHQGIAFLHDLLASDAVAENAGALLRVPLHVAKQLDHERFRGVVIAGARRFRS